MTAMNTKKVPSYFTFLTGGEHFGLMLSAKLFINAAGTETASTSDKNADELYTG